MSNDRGNDPQLEPGYRNGPRLKPGYRNPESPELKFIFILARLKEVYSSRVQKLKRATVVYPEYFVISYIVWYDIFLR